MTSLGTIVGSGVAWFAFILVLVVPQPSFPSIDDQIKKILEPFDMLFRIGIVRDRIQQTTSTILFDKFPLKDEIFFKEGYYHAKYFNEDKNLAQEVLDAVMKDPFLLGKEKAKMEMRNEIKKDFNNGTLTDIEVENILHKILDILREKTKVELNKYIDDNLNRRFNEIMEHFDNFYRIGDVRDIINETIKNTWKEDHAKHSTNNKLVFNERQYVNVLKKDKNLRQRVLDGAMKDPLLLGTDESKLEAKNGIMMIKRDLKNGTFTDVEADNIIKILLNRMRQKTKNELRKFIDEHIVVNNSIHDKTTKEKQHKIHNK